MIGVKRMDKTWIDEFYREMDADKRLVLLKENIESNPTEEDAFRKKLWIARYGRKKPKKDAYVGCLMELKYLAEGGTLDIGGKKKRQAARIAADMYLNSPEVQEDRYREILREELKHVFLKFMEVSSQGRGFKSQSRSARSHFRLRTCFIWTGNFIFYNKQHFQRSGRNIQTESIF